MPENLIYLDGNSLGPLPKRTLQLLDTTVREEWGGGLIRSWNQANWINRPRKLGDKIAPLVGANSGEVLVADSTSVNLFKVLSAAIQMNKDRRVILCQEDEFPSDLYIAEGVVDLIKGDYRRVLVPSGGDIQNHIDETTAVVLLSHVDFKTGRIRDLPAITKTAHRQGALVIWDLSHSVGAIPIQLHENGVDFAVGSTYKHLCGGPGSPAFLYVHNTHIQKASQPLRGWFGHLQPFTFTVDYKPAKDIGKFLCGTPPILSFKALESGLEIFADVPIREIWKKGMRLTGLFIQLMQQECGEFDFKLLSPEPAEQRGLQISYAHEKAFPIIQALNASNVVGDFRHPNIMRFGVSPLFLRFVDIWEAVRALKQVMGNGEWRRPQFNRPATVT